MSVVEMKSLLEIGFKPGGIYEVIVEVKGGNAAPMGVWAEDGTQLRVCIYDTSRTCLKVRKEKEFRLFWMILIR